MIDVMNTLHVVSLRKHDVFFRLQHRSGGTWTLNQGDKELGSISNV